MTMSYMKDSMAITVLEQLRLPKEGFPAFTEGDATTKEHSPESRSYPTLFGQALQGLARFLKALAKKTWKVALEDPRRLIHSAKVGLALAAVSLLILLEKPYYRIGKNAIWAVMTVVVVFEFTAGATLSKGLNRVLGTLIAGFLGLAISYLAECGGKVGEPLTVGLAVFIAGGAATFLRFFPRIKSRYDYGVVIFLLTFCLIVVSGYRVGDALRTTKDRLLIICIGCGISLAICLFIYLIWAGDDLHNMISENFQRIADSLEACVTAYCQEQSKAQHLTSKLSIEDDPIYQRYRVLLLSSHTEESLANFAHWEPHHGCFKPKYPWRTYVRMGVALRYCAYAVMALHGCLRSDIQASQKLRATFQEDVTFVGNEAAKVLRELGESVRRMQKRKSEDIMALLTKGVEDLQKSVDVHAKVLINAQRWTIEEDVQSKLGAEKTSNRAYHVLDAPAVIVPNDCRFKKCCPELTIAENAIEDEPCNAHASIPQAEASPLYSKSFRSSFKTGQKTVESASAVSLVTFISLLVETVARLEHVVDVADELADQAGFKNPKQESGVDTVHRWRDTASLQQLDGNNQVGE